MAGNDLRITDIAIRPCGRTTILTGAGSERWELEVHVGEVSARATFSSSHEFAMATHDCLLNIMKAYGIRRRNSELILPEGA